MNELSTHTYACELRHLRASGGRRGGESQCITPSVLACRWERASAGAALSLPPLLTTVPLTDFFSEGGGCLRTQAKERGLCHVAKTRTNTSAGNHARTHICNSPELFRNTKSRIAGHEGCSEASRSGMRGATNVTDQTHTRRERDRNVSHYTRTCPPPLLRPSAPP